MSLLGKVRLAMFSKCSLPFFHTILTISLVIAIIFAAVVVALAGYFIYIIEKVYGTIDNYNVLAVVTGGLTIIILPV
jgi:hypothetical protein